jgi:hypothetical protein
MADDKEKKDNIILKIKEKISQLDKESARAYREQLKGLDEINSSLSTYQNLLNNINTTIDDQLEGFEGLLKQISAINDELSSQNKYYNNAIRALRGLESIATQLKNDQKGYTDLTKEQLKKEQAKLKILHDQAKMAAEVIKARGAQNEKEEAILQGYEDQFKVFERTNELLKQRIKEEDKLNKKLGVTGVLLTGMSKIPIVGPLLKTNEALDAAREKAKAGGNAFTVMGTAMTSMGKGLLSSLMDPLAIIGLIVKAFQFLLELGFKFDNQITSLQKTLYLSRTEADLMHDSFIENQATSEVLVKNFNTSLLTLQNQVEAANQLGTSFGFITRATDEEIQNQLKLTKQMGLSVEESQALYVLARQNNMTQEDITQEAINQVNAVKKQTGATLDVKKVLQDVSKISGQLRLQYANNPKLLAAAVIQAQKLGFTLEQTKKIAEGLLNFEESIENELSAELLIGRDLNLEQARLLALNGKSAEAVALLAQEMGGAAGFAAMNVISQEAIAKALGMSADEMANSMMTQENLANLGAEEKQRLEDEIAALEYKGEFEKAAQLERAAANGANIEAAIAQLTAQEEFYNNIEKIKDEISALAKGPAMAIAETMTSLVGSADKLLNTVKYIGIAFLGIKLGSLLLQLGSAAALAGTLAASAITAIGYLTLGVGLVAIGAAVASAMGVFDSDKEQGSMMPASVPGAGGGSSFAKGGIVRSRIDNATIGEAGPEAIVPLSSPAAQQMMGGGPIQVTVYGQIDKQTLFSFIAEGERTNSNNLGSERQINNRGIQ